MKAKHSLSSFLGSRLSLITVCALGCAGSSQAETWTNTTTGTSTWSTGSNWDTLAAPASATNTAITFFATPSTVIPAASVIVANQDIATPIIVNSLTINGSGPGSGAVPSLTVSGGAIQFDGTTPSLNVNAAYGGVGYTVNLNSNLVFNADTAINFSTGGAFINVGGAVTFGGAGKVTFTGGLNNRPLSLTAAGTFTGDMVITGANSVVNLNQTHNILGPNTATNNPQTVTIASGAAVNLAYGDGAYTQPQNFVVNGTGHATASSGAALNATNIDYGNGAIGGLALASDATVRLTLKNATDARGDTLQRGIVGTGKLTKTGNAALYLNVASPASVTWGGTTYSAYTGDVDIKEGLIQTPTVSNALGSNTLGTQRVTVSAGASFVVAAGTNAWTQPQTIIINGNGSGYIANTGGVGALESFGAAFGSNQVRSVVVASDASISVKRDAGSGLACGLNLATQGLAGTGNLSVGSVYGSATSPLYLNKAAAAFAEFPAFSGNLIINNGIVNVGDPAALGATTAGKVTLNGLGAISSSLTGGLNQAFFARIANLATTTGTLALGSNNVTNNLDFTTAPYARLGAINNYTYSGTLTPAANTYRLGGGGGTLTVSSALVAGNSVVISGSVILSSMSNTFDGGITISGNNTGVGQTAALNQTGGIGSLNGNAISFSGTGGSYAYTGAATGSANTLGTLAFTTGQASISSIYGTSGNTSLTFSSMTARSAGATGNFTVTNGTNGSTNKIVITGLAAGFVDKGIFFGGTNYAYNDATGYLRAPVYGTDAGFVTSAATTTLASATHQQITGALSAQNSATFTTLKIAGANNIALAAAQTLTVDGLLKTGNNATTISGGAGIQASSGSEWVVRADQGSDAITISTPVLANGASSLTKTGAGSLTLTAANTYTGGTTVAVGTLTVSGSGRLDDTGAVNVTGGTYNVSVADTVGAVTLKNGSIGGSSALTGASYAVENGSISPPLAGSGSSLVKSTAGAVVLTGANTYTGSTTVTAGTLEVDGSTAAGSTVGIDTAGTLTGTGTINGSATLTGSGVINKASGTIGGTLGVTGGNWNGAGSVTGLVTSSSGTFTIGSGANLTATGGLSVTGGNLAAATPASTITGSVNYVSSTASTFGGILAGAGKTLTLNNAAATLTLSGANTYSGATAVTAGTLALVGGSQMSAITVSSGASLGFTLGSATTSTSTVTFDSGSTVKITGTPTLASYTLVTATAITGTPVLDSPISGYTLAVEGGGTILKLNQAGYSTWAAINAPTGTSSDDYDGDGVSNGAEYVLGGTHLTNDLGNLPQATTAGGDLAFTFTRHHQSIDAATTVNIEVSTDLATWPTSYAVPSVAVTNALGVTVVKNSPDADHDTVTLTVAQAPDAKKFARLQVITP